MVFLTDFIDSLPGDVVDLSAQFSVQINLGFVDPVLTTIFPVKKHLVDSKYSIMWKQRFEAKRSREKGSMTAMMNTEQSVNNYLL